MPLTPQPPGIGCGRVALEVFAAVLRPFALSLGSKVRQTTNPDTYDSAIDSLPPFLFFSCSIWKNKREEERDCRTRAFLHFARDFPKRYLQQFLALPSCRAPCPVLSAIKFKVTSRLVQWTGCGAVAALSKHYTIQPHGLGWKRSSAGLSDKRLQVHGVIPKLLHM